MKINDKIRVLIAEDNPVVIATIKKSLKDIGFELAGVALNGLEAIDMAISIRPDVILMDLEMPELDGFSAVRQILEHYSVPIVIVTAHENDSFVKKASDVGASAYLLKPPKSKEIERAIIMALSRHNDLMELRRINRILESKNEELSKALAEVKILRGIIPICAACKNIRDDQGFWKKVENYITDRSEAEFSHSICPDCATRLYPEFIAEKR